MVHLDTAEFEDTYAPPQAEEAQPQQEAEVHEHWRLTDATLRHASRSYRERHHQLLENIGNGTPLFNVTDYVTVSEQPHAAPDAEDPHDRSGTLIRVRTTLSGAWAEQWTPTPFQDCEALAAESAHMARDVMRSALGTEQSAENSRSH